MLILLYFMPQYPLNKGILVYHQSLIRHKAFGILIVLFLAIKIVIYLFFPAQNIGQASDLTSDNILRAINEQRSLRNLVTLNTNNKLTSAAQSKADDMQARHYFAHIDPDGHYIWDKIISEGYSPYLQLGENLAIEFFDTDSLVSAWMNSPGHRDNILQQGFKDDGMGLAFGNSSQGQYHSAIANTFGTLAVFTKVEPANPPPAPVANPTPQPAAPKPVPPPSPAPSPTPLTPTQPKDETQPLKEIIKPRQDRPLAAASPTPGFALPEHNPAPVSQLQATPTAPLTAIVGNQGTNTFSGLQANRYLIFVCGLALLLLMLSDIKRQVEKKLVSIDKKINNLVVLLISLIVIAFMYWL